MNGENVLMRPEGAAFVERESADRKLYWPLMLMGVREFFASSWRVLGVNWKVFLLLGAIYLLVTEGSGWTIGAVSSQGLAVMLAGVVISLAAQIVIGIAVILAADKASEGLAADVGEVALSFSWRLVGRYIWTWILYYLIVLGGSLLLIIPGTVWAVKYILAPYVVVIENVGARQALSRSAALTDGNKLRIAFRQASFGLLFVLAVSVPLALLTAIIAGLLGQPFPPRFAVGPTEFTTSSSIPMPAWAQIIQALGTTLWQGLYIIFNVLLFKSLGAVKQMMTSPADDSAMPPLGDRQGVAAAGQPARREKRWLFPIALALGALALGALVILASTLPQADRSGAAGDAYQSGNAYLDRGAYDRAIADYDKAIQLKPDYAEAYSSRGAAYYYKGDYDRAIANYDQAIQLKPDYAEAYSNRGAAYRGQGNYDRALADYDKAIQLKPDYAKAYANRGDAYTNQGAYDRALADCDKAIQLKPGYAEAYNNRGAAYYYKGDYDHAIADWDEVIRLSPDDAEGYNNRGYAYYQKGDYDRAITDFDKAMQLMPNYVEAYAGRGLSYEVKGEKDKATADFQKTLELSGDPQVRQSIETHLAALGAQ